MSDPTTTAQTAAANEPSPVLTTAIVAVSVGVGIGLTARPLIGALIGGALGLVLAGGYISASTKPYASDGS